MAFVDIAAREDLENWLTNKPGSWARVVATRAALRAFPHLNNASRKFLALNSDVLFQAITSSWGSLNVPAVKFETKAIATAADTIDFILIRSKESVSVQMAGDSIYLASALKDPISGKTVAQAVKSSAEAAASYVYEEPLLEESREFLDAADRYAVIRNIWSAASSDCNWLGSEGNQTQAARRLTCFRLWHFGFSKEWKDNWVDLKGKLLAIDPNYSVWIDWYERRIRGERAAFDIPGDKGRIEDKKILRRLAEATDEDFWGKGHEYVNATLKGWLDEARTRASANLVLALPVGLAEETNTAFALPPLQIETPPQNRNALSFQADENGKISINATALADQLRADTGAQDRHAEAVAEAKIVFDRCQRSNAGARLTRLFENYLAAVGEGVEEAQPSLLVQRGERLRQELAAYQNPDSFLDPLADDLLLDMRGWQSAHNMMVGLDPVLNAMDVATLGPDKQPALISPDEIKEKAREANEAELLQNGVLEIVEEAADLAPAIPDPADRHTIWSTEMVRNLMIETASIALNNPVKTSAIVAGFAGGGLVGGISIMGSIKAAEYLVNHREWVLARLGNTPTWQALIAKLADWLEKVTPFAPK